jgi:hypothetical protein
MYHRRRPDDWVTPHVAVLLLDIHLSRLREGKILAVEEASVDRSAL